MIGDAVVVDLTVLTSYTLDYMVFKQYPLLDASQRIAARVYGSGVLSRAQKDTLLPLAYHHNHPTGWQVMDEHCFVWVGAHNQLVIRRKGKYRYISATNLINTRTPDDLALLHLYAQGKIKKARKIMAQQYERIMAEKEKKVPI